MLSLTCTESEVNVMITGTHTTPDLYAVTATQHTTNRTGTDSTYSVRVLNPTTLYTGPSAMVEGSIKVYRIY